MQKIHETRFHEIEAEMLYALLQFRVEIFVVEQKCPYPELDGRDFEITARHIWLDKEQKNETKKMPAAYLRVLKEADGSSRIGRVATSASLRHRGLASVLIEHAIATTPSRLVLDAQIHLEDWYARFGFSRSGNPFVEDGITHVPMAK